MKRSYMVCDNCIKLIHGFCMHEPIPVDLSAQGLYTNTHACAQGMWHEWSDRFNTTEPYYWGEWED